MITYFIKSALCLTLLLAFYHLILEREKMHTFNRFYLLGSILFSFLAPLYTIYIYTPEVLETATPILTENFAIQINTTEANNSINYWFYVMVFYLTISSTLLIRFGKNLHSILKKISINKKVKIEKATLVLVEEKVAPHTFWNYIFVNNDDYFNEKLEDELYTHELAHATQKHTFDVLLIELLQIVLWINPVIYLLKKAVKLNHEFLADNKVIHTYKNISEYQYLLLNKSHKNDYYLASNLNYLLTKKRLQMMTKQTTKRVLWLKKLAVIPLVISTIFLFAKRVEAQEIASKKELAEYNILAKKHNTSNKQRVALKDIKRLNYLYAKMNESQKKNAEPFPNFPPPPPPLNNVKTGFKKIDGSIVYYVTYGSVKKYYNKQGKRVDNNGKEISAKKAYSTEIIPGQNISKIYKDGKVFCSFINTGVKKGNIPPPPPPQLVVKKGERSNIPPPPPPAPMQK